MGTVINCCTKAVTALMIKDNYNAPLTGQAAKISRWPPGTRSPIPAAAATARPAVREETEEIKHPAFRY
jgi:hypothetical protein